MEIGRRKEIERLDGRTAIQYAEKNGIRFYAMDFPQDYGAFWS